MPRYHFNLLTGKSSVGDVNGRELSDDAAAIEEGASAVGEVLMDELTLGAKSPSVVVTVERVDGTKLAIIKAQAQVETFLK